MIDRTAHHKFVFVCARTISERTKQKAYTKCRAANVDLTIFDFAALTELYGPSMSRHPSFKKREYFQQRSASQKSKSKAVGSKSKSKAATLISAVPL